MGVISLHAGESALSRMQDILDALQPRLAADEDESVRDNAIGALARLVISLGPQLPLGQIVPVIVEALPLMADVGENAPAVMHFRDSSLCPTPPASPSANLSHHRPLSTRTGLTTPRSSEQVRCLMKLSCEEATRPFVGGHMPKLLLVFGKLLRMKLEDMSVQREMRTFLIWLKGIAAGQLEQGVMGLPQQERDSLLEALQGA